MIKPIPKKLLPHKCFYQEYLGNNGEGDEWGEKTPLSFVKIEEKTVLKVTSNGREIVGNARMFYDLGNSKGLHNKPIENSKIILKFNDDTTQEEIDAIKEFFENMYKDSAKMLGISEEELDNFMLDIEKTFIKELKENGAIGSISELYDSKKPQLPKGAIAQAWSVAEIFRIILKK